MTMYFDYTASAPVKQHVLENYTANMRTFYASPSSHHFMGEAGSKLIAEAKEIIAKSLDCSETEIVFTSGATEAINSVLKGSAYALSPSAPRRMLTTAGEHAATNETADFLERYCDFQVDRIGLKKSGEVDLEEWQKALSEQEYSLASFIYVSNENGAINDMEQIVKMVRQSDPRTLIHSDVVQAIGKLPFSFRKSDLDFASLSGHKIGAPNSSGLLLIKDKKQIEPLIHGGKQQKGRRSGTEDASLFYALAEAVESTNDNITASYDRVVALKDRFLNLLKQFELPHKILSPENGLALIQTISFPGLRGETMQNALSARHIAVSTGSACHADQAGKNEVLAAMGYDKETIANSVRFSFNVVHTSKDVDLLVQAICQIYEEYAR